ncbi:hypothetical protein J1614_011867 [Plenodomus biglobosus]|nr:hypothetical protein J1614_011867 [Plenodomus biglobosus]
MVTRKAAPKKTTTAPPGEKVSSVIGRCMKFKATTRLRPSRTTKEAWNPVQSEDDCSIDRRSTDSIGPMPLFPSLKYDSKAIISGRRP